MQIVSDVKKMARFAFHESEMRNQAALPPSLFLLQWQERRKTRTHNIWWALLLSLEEKTEWRKRWGKEKEGGMHSRECKNSYKGEKRFVLSKLAWMGNKQIFRWFYYVALFTEIHYKHEAHYTVNVNPYYLVVKMHFLCIACLKHCDTLNSEHFKIICICGYLREPCRGVTVIDILQWMKTTSRNDTF